MAVGRDQMIARVGGAEFARSGSWYRRGPFDKYERTKPLFTRADTGPYATAVGADGLPRAVAANRVRPEYIDLDGDGIRETCTLHWESRRKNLAAWSESFSHWSDPATPATVTSAVDTCGIIALDRLADSDAANFRYKFMGVAFTGDGTKAISFHTKQDGANTKGAFDLNDATASIVRGAVDITWAAGVPTPVASGGATLLRTESLGNGVYRLHVAISGIVAANANNLRFFGASRTVASDVGSALYGGVQAEDAARTSSYIRNTSATLNTRFEDVPSVQPFPYLWLDEYTVYMKWVNDKPTTDTDFPEFWALRSDANAGTWPSARGFFGSLNHGFNVRDDLNTIVDTPRNAPVFTVKEYTYRFRNYVSAAGIEYFNEDTLIGSAANLVAPCATIGLNPRLSFWTGGGGIGIGAFGWLIDWKMAHGIYTPTEMRAA